MNRYLTFSSTGFGYQIIARNSINQTYRFDTYFNGIMNTLNGNYAMEFRSDMNYQLAIL